MATGSYTGIKKAPELFWSLCHNVFPEVLFFTVKNGQVVNDPAIDH